MSTIVTPREAFPRLIVQHLDSAIAVHRTAFDAELIARFVEPDGFVEPAKLAPGDVRLSLSEEMSECERNSARSLRGAAIPLQVDFVDGDPVAKRMIAEKAEVVIPIKYRSWVVTKEAVG